MIRWAVSDRRVPPGTAGAPTRLRCVDPCPCSIGAAFCRRASRAATLMILQHRMEVLLRARAYRTAPASTQAARERVVRDRRAQNAGGV